MIYNPSCSQEQLEKKFKKLRKLNYNAFRWWRMYDDPKPLLSKQSPLLDRIKNGDFNYSHYNYQAMWCEHEMNKVYNKFGFDDMGRYVEETSLLRSRRKRLLEDHYKEEDTRLESITIELAKNFKITKDEVKTLMGEFDGTLEELYIHLQQKYPYNKFYLPKSLKHLQSRYD
jgi:hypothetical protein